MTMTYRSDALESIHESMMALYAVGAIDQQTMQEFDEVCLKFDPLPASVQEGPKACQENSEPAGRQVLQRQTTLIALAAQECWDQGFHGGSSVAQWRENLSYDRVNS